MLKNLPLKHQSSGFALIGVIAAIAIVLGALVYIIKPDQFASSQVVEQPVEVSPAPQILESTATPVASSTASPVATPTLKPTSTPTPKPTPVASATPAPTTQPQAVSGPPTSGHSRITVKTEVGNFTASIVSIDMAGVRMITDTGNDDNCVTDCITLSLGDYVARNGGFAGINGSYFCPATYPDCQDKKNSFDFPVYNSRLSKWINQDKLFWDNRAMIYQDGSGVHFKKEAKSFGGGLTAGVTNYPALLDGGNIVVQDYTQSQKQETRGTKGGIGIRGNTVYLVIASATMTEFAHIFKSLGATDALNLDGGGSAALWYNGYKAGPGRALPNAIIFAR